MKKETKKVIVTTKDNSGKLVSINFMIVFKQYKTKYGSLVSPSPKDMKMLNAFDSWKVEA